MEDQRKEKVLFISENVNPPVFMRKLADDYKTKIIPVSDVEAGGKKPENKFVTVIQFQALDLQSIELCVESFRKINSNVILVSSRRPTSRILEKAYNNGFINTIYPPLSHARVKFLIDHLMEQQIQRASNKAKIAEQPFQSADHEKQIKALKAEMEENINMRLDLKRLKSNLARKLREMNIMLQIMNISERTGLSLEEFMRDSLQVMVNGFAEKGKCRGTFRFRDKKVIVGNIDQQGVKPLKKQILFKGNFVGEIEILKTDKTNQDSLYVEEKGLLSAFAKHLGYILLRRESENENRENLQKFQTLVNIMKDFLVIVDPDGKILFMNPSAEKRLGDSPGMFPERSLFDLIPGPDNHLLKKPLSELFYRNINVDTGVELEFRDGKRYYDLSLRPLSTRSHKPASAMALFHDVTSYKKAVQMLEKSRHDFELLSENAPSGVVIVSKEFKVLFTNRKIEEIYETTTEEFRKSSIFNYVLPEEKDEMADRIRKRFRGKYKGNHFVQKIISAKGNIRYIEVLAAHTEWSGKEAILYNILDISNRIKMENWSDMELKIYKLSGRNMSKVSFSEKLIETLMDIDWVDSGGLYILDEKREILELISHRGLGDPFVDAVRRFDLKSHHYRLLEKGDIIYDFGDKMKGKDKELLSGESIQTLIIIPLMDKDKVIGSLNLASHKAHNVITEDRAMLLNLGHSISQILAHRNTRQNLLELNKELKKNLNELRHKQQLLIQKSKLESLGELSAGIAHEINQPLGIISLALENIQQSLETGSPGKDYLGKKFALIYERIEKARQILEHIRIFSRDQKTLMPERVNINKVIENALGLLNQQYISHQITIAQNLDNNIGIILGNPNKLEQVILNLLSNARHALEKKAERAGPGFKMKIILKTFEKDGFVNIICRDNGAGIAPEDLDKVFNPFFTTKSTEEGTGLGLSIVYGIVKEINGKINVNSKPGESTTFHIRLPVRNALHAER